MACLCSMMSGASGGQTLLAYSDAPVLSDPATWGQNHLEAPSLISLAVDAYRDWDFSWGTTGWPTCVLTCGFFTIQRPQDSWISCMVAEEYRSQHLTDKEETASPFITKSQNPHSVTSAAFFSLQMSDKLLRLKGRGHRFHFLVRGVLRPHCRRACGLGDVVAASLEM